MECNYHKANCSDLIIETVNSFKWDMLSLLTWYVPRCAIMHSTRANTISHQWFIIHLQMHVFVCL